MKVSISIIPYKKNALVSNLFAAIQRHNMGLLKLNSLEIQAIAIPFEERTGVKVEIKTNLDCTRTEIFQEGELICVLEFKRTKEETGNFPDKFLSEKLLEILGNERKLMREPVWTR